MCFLQYSGGRRDPSDHCADGGTSPPLRGPAAARWRPYRPARPLPQPPAGNGTMELIN